MNDVDDDKMKGYRHAVRQAYANVTGNNLVGGTGCVSMVVEIKRASGKKETFDVVGFTDLTPEQLSEAFKNGSDTLDSGA